MDTRNHLFNAVDSFKEILTSFLQEKSHLHKIEKDILMDKLRALYMEISEHPESARLLTFEDFVAPTSEESLPDIEVEVFEMPSPQVEETPAAVEEDVPAFEFAFQPAAVEESQPEVETTATEPPAFEEVAPVEEVTSVEPPAFEEPIVEDESEVEAPSVAALEESVEPESVVPPVFPVTPPPIIPTEPLNKLEKLLNDLKDLTGSTDEQKPATDENGDVVFDLNLTKKEERPLSYYAIERKLALEEKGISEEEAAQQSPKVSIVNPFVGKPTQQNVPPAEVNRVIPPHLKEQMEKKEEPVRETPVMEEPTISTPPPVIEQKIEVPTPAPVVEEKPAPEAPKPVFSGSFSIEQALDFAGNPALKNQLRLKPIENLKNGIGLNEKFLYIRELFSNDHIMFANVVSAINDLGSLAEAEQYILNQYISTGRWQEENPHVNGFLQIIYRRFVQ